MLSIVTEPLHLFISIYIWIIIISAILSFLPIDRQHPVVEVLNKLTEPLFGWVRQKMPFVIVSGIDLSPILVIVALQFIDSLLVLGPLMALAQVVHSLIFTYIIIVIIAAVLSFVQVSPYNPIVSTLNRLTQPLFQFIRQKLPFVVMGGIDLSPIVVIFSLQLIDGLFTRLMLGM
jgi:YggT family protein